MKIQRKLLTEEQKRKICGGRVCYDCPMAYRDDGLYHSCEKVRRTEESIRNYWDEEVEVEG